MTGESVAERAAAVEALLAWKPGDPWPDESMSAVDVALWRAGYDAGLAAQVPADVEVVLAEMEERGLGLVVQRLRRAGLSAPAPEPLRAAVEALKLKYETFQVAGSLRAHLLHDLQTLLAAHPAPSGCLRDPACKGERHSLRCQGFNPASPVPDQTEAGT